MKSEVGIEHSSQSRTCPVMLGLLRENDEEAWASCIRLYRPLIFYWCRNAGLQDAEAEDVVQDVFKTVARHIRDFRHDREGDTFRGWLRTITRTKLADFHRRHARVGEGPGQGGSEARDRFRAVPEDAPDLGSSDENDRLLLLRGRVELTLAKCEETTRLAFRRVCLEGESPAAVAEDLGITRNALYLATSRVMRKVRKDVENFIDG